MERAEPGARARLRQREGASRRVEPGRLGAAWLGGFSGPEGRPIVRLVSSLVIYPVGIACVAALFEASALLAACLAALSVVTLLLDRRPGDLVVFAGGAALGPVAEIVAVAAGAWTYRAPDLLGIPIWLPVGWGLATLLIKRISEGLLEIRRRPRA